MKTIEIRGARTHNLKNINVSLPRDQFIVITGLSGSGKSSLAFDTLYAEGQRRYVESLSSYARQFLSMMEKPDIDHIEGLSPAISIEQKSTSHNPRSTVGTVTEIYDYLRLLFARVGEPHCPEHDTVLSAQTVGQMVDTVLALPEETKIMILAPLIEARKGEHVQVLEKLRAQGFIRVRLNGEIYELESMPVLAKNKKHTIDVIIDRLKIRQDMRVRLAESFETALKLSDGLAKIVSLEEEEVFTERLFSARFSCFACGYSMPELSPRLFSFNSPQGACSACNGLGIKELFDAKYIVCNPKLSIAEGAIVGWDYSNVFYFKQLEAVAKHYNFDLYQPFENLSKEIQDIILYGSGKEWIAFKYKTEQGRIYDKTKAFEGVLPILERRYKETESMAVREYLSKYLSTYPCNQCAGTRLRKEARHVFINQWNLPQVVALPVSQSLEWVQKLNLSGWRKEVSQKISQEIEQRLKFLINVGLEYLTLNRAADTLSGGEAQRIRLASQIGAGLVGVMYILDEPSIGLHQRDNERLLKTLIQLRDLGNTVIVVEHDEDAILAADYIVDMGPGAGVHGGEIVAQGKIEEVCKSPYSITGDYIAKRRYIPVPVKRKEKDESKILLLEGASGNNLKNLNIEIPLGLLTCITGVSGSGKSTLINNTLYPIAASDLMGATRLEIAPYRAIKGLEHLTNVINIDQSPIGRTPRSNPATYTGIFTPIRELFAATPEARARGYSPGRFSFNVRGGYCEACQGDGVLRVEMHFLADIYVTCDVCKGQRYNRETLDIYYKGKNIYQVLEMSIEEAYDFFKAIPILERKLKVLMNVGLGYIRLGQNATTLSGGEAQRIKLSRELSKRGTGSTLYILDEPTTGLHFYDIEQLLKVLHQLRDQGNTVVIIEHNLEVIKTADWIIDLGPEGGEKGGQIVAIGTPEEVVKCKHSYTGLFLKALLEYKFNHP